MALFTGACVLLWPNTEAGWAAGVNVHAQAEAFDRDLAAGTPLFRLVRRYTPFLHPSQESLHEALTLLQRGRIGGSNRSRRTRLFKSKPSNSLPPTFASPGGTTAASRSRESTRGSASICPRPYLSAASASATPTPTPREPRRGSGSPGAGPASASFRPSSSTRIGTSPLAMTTPRPSGWMTWSPSSGFSRTIAPVGLRFRS